MVWRNNSMKCGMLLFLTANLLHYRLCDFIHRDSDLANEKITHAVFEKRISNSDGKLRNNAIRIITIQKEA